MCACVCVCDSVGGGLLVQMQAFSFLFCFVPPPQPSARPGGKEDWENREAFPKKLSTRFFFFMDRKTRRELLALGVQLIQYRTL